MPASKSDWQALARARLKKLLSRARKLPGLSKRTWSIEVEFLSAPAMRKLNRSFRKKNYATDVLSFPAPRIFQKGQKGLKGGTLGELVICLPVLKRQARQFGHSPEEELDVLLAHGLLHLLGLDHERSAKEARRMAALEQKLLKGLGLLARG